MLTQLISRLISTIKQREFKLDEAVADRDLLALMARHSLGLSRGLIRCRKLVSIGKQVRLSGKSKLTLGKGVSIGDYNVIEAIGKQGLIIGDGSSIGSFCLIKVSGSLTQLGQGITLGRNVGMGDFAHVGGAGGVVIGDDTIIGSYFSVHPEEHVFTDIDQPIRLQGVSHKGIRVGRGCWIGAKVTLLDGAAIGDGCVVAAGAVVKGEFPNNCVIGGVPAKIIKRR